MIETILDLIRDPAIGNSAMIFLAYGLWRVERRMIRVETILAVREASE